MDGPDSFQPADDYLKVEHVLQTFDTHGKPSPDLNRIAHSAGVTVADLDRLFIRWAGVGPKQFFSSLTPGRTKDKLQDHRRFSSPDTTVSIVYDTAGLNWTANSRRHIKYGLYPSPFGQCLLAVADQIIHYLGFVVGSDPSGVLNHMYHHYKGADFEENIAAVEPIGQAVFFNDMGRNRRRLQVQPKGTAFQLEVWRALLKIPPGHLVSYQDVADHIGRPSAVRAVAGAIANNPVAYLIPCHRVIAKSGKIHQYRWGALRKKAMIGYEGGITPTLDKP